MGYDYDEYEPTEEEIQEIQGKQSTDVDFDFEKLQIFFDVKNFAEGIASEVKRTLKNEIISDLKKEVLKDLKDDIQNNIAKMSYDIEIGRASCRERV